MWRMPVILCKMNCERDEMKTSIIATLHFVILVHQSPKENCLSAEKTEHASFNTFFTLNYTLITLL